MWGCHASLMINYILNIVHLEPVDCSIQSNLL